MKRVVMTNQRFIVLYDVHKCGVIDGAYAQESSHHYGNQRAIRRVVFRLRSKRVCAAFFTQYTCILAEKTTPVHARYNTIPLYSLC